MGTVMIAYQLTIPAENAPGRLASVTAVLRKEKINIRAITISSFGKQGFFNILVDAPEKARQALKDQDIEVHLKKVIAVLIEDKPGGLDQLVQYLAENRVNVENAYGFVLESYKNAVFVIDVDDITEAQKLLEASNFKTLNAEALASVEPFHYMKY